MSADLTKTVQCPYCGGEGGSESAEEYDWSECYECDGTGAMTIAAVHDRNSWFGSFGAQGQSMVEYDKLKAEPVPAWILNLPAATPKERAHDDD
jgi:hypothetical protein